MNADPDNVVRVSGVGFSLLPEKLMKTCKKCLVEKAQKDFTKGKAVCKKCRTDARKASGCGRVKPGEGAYDQVGEDRHFRTIPTTQAFIDNVANNPKYTRTEVDYTAYVLASLIAVLSKTPRNGHMACIPWQSMDQIWSSEREVMDIKDILVKEGVIKPVEGKYDVIIMSTPRGVRIKRKQVKFVAIAPNDVDKGYTSESRPDQLEMIASEPKGYAPVTLQEVEHFNLSGLDSESAAAHPDVQLIQMFHVVGHVDCIDWKRKGYPMHTITSKKGLERIVCNTGQRNLSNPINNALVDPLFYGIDWKHAMAIAQNDIVKADFTPDTFVHDGDGTVVELSEQVKSETKLNKNSLISIREQLKKGHSYWIQKAVSSGKKLPASEMTLIQQVQDKVLLYPEILPSMYGKEDTPEQLEAYNAFPQASRVSMEREFEAIRQDLIRFQTIVAKRVKEGRVVARQRSNTRIHNSVSALKDPLKDRLIGVNGQMLPKDVNNAGIASAAYKVSHLADTHEDVRRFMQDAMDGTFYRKAYDWLSENGVKFESEYDDGGKAEIKYGTRIGRTDHKGTCSGVLPHLYHSGTVAYQWLAEQGCNVGDSGRRTRMQDWAYSNYPTVYSVIDEEKRKIAEAWLTKELTDNAEKYEKRLAIYKRIDAMLDEGMSHYDIAKLLAEEDGSTYIDREGRERLAKFKEREKNVKKIHNWREEGKKITIEDLNMPSAYDIREKKITSQVSRSIHDCETAGQWKGVLKFKERYPDATIVSVHDCIFTDTDREYLGECLVWGWANCLIREDGTTYGVGVSVDNDEH